MKNIWKAGIFGVVVGDTLGCPVQFESREKVATHPVTGMRGQGTFNLPAGSWTDDSSLTLALLDSIGRTGKMDLKDIMGNFVEWLEHGAFTPYGYSYDIGFGTEQAIQSYMKSGNPFTCGGTASSNNGNGSLNITVKNSTDVNEYGIHASLYPNPTNGNVTIEADGMQRITVVNELGQVVYDAEVNDNTAILNMSQFGAGVFMVRIYAENGMSVKRVNVVR